MGDSGETWCDDTARGMKKPRLNEAGEAGSSGGKSSSAFRFQKNMAEIRSLAVEKGKREQAAQALEAEKGKREQAAPVDMAAAAAAPTSAEMEGKEGSPQQKRKVWLCRYN
ncbi:unnamed protein product [Ectocarpus sp. 6 AP-2014]